MSLPAIRHRLASGLPAAALAILALLFLPDAAVPFAVAGLMALLMLEFYQMIEPAGLPSFKWFGTFWAVVLVFATWFGPESGAGDAAVLFGATVLVFLRLFPQKENPRPLATVAGTLFGLMYIGLLWNFITKLLGMEPPIGGGHVPGNPWAALHVTLGPRLAVLYGAVVAKFTDVGAYVVGCLCGKHKLIPRISPAKSWEGVFGGIAVGAGVGTAFAWLCGEPMWNFGLWPARAFAVGVVLSVCSIVGDLTESMFKRGAGVKDSGGVLPGLGGMLDIFDSLLFAYPALYLYVRLFLP
jgi:phosphatidate cytidylyltransferase